MRGFQRGLAPLLVFVLLLGLRVPARAVSDARLQSAVAESAAYLLKSVESPQVGSVGGEWAVLGLARSGCDVPEGYFQSYRAAVEACVAERKGVLSERKYTEYARVVLALTAIGEDPTRVAGYNLLTPLGDFEQTVRQGINGSVWALLALDAGNYAMPENPAAATQATRERYIDELLRRQLDDGGWNLTDAGGAGMADADITGMALQALAKYRTQARVQAAADRALDCLSAMQDSSGGFASSESVAQVLTALCELGVSPDDPRFVKDGNSALDCLLSYRQADGSFKHTANGSGSSQLSSEQGFYALVAALRAADGKSSLYRMDDAVSVGTGLSGKHTDVNAMPVTVPGATFADAAGSDNRAAIEALAQRGIVSGKGNGLFAPDANMTRAEFAALVTTALGLAPHDTGVFADVGSDRWYAGYVGTANQYGMISGVGGGLFDPEGTLTRQEAAVMVTGAAKLCGMDTRLKPAETQNALAQFGDCAAIADWAREGVAFCYSRGILDKDDLNAAPNALVLRGQLAQMLFNLLSAASLI